VVQAGDRPGFASAQDVGQFRHPLVNVDSAAFRWVEPVSRQAQKGVGQVIKPVADFLAQHVGDDSQAEAPEDADGG